MQKKILFILLIATVIVSQIPQPAWLSIDHPTGSTQTVPLGLSCAMEAHCQGCNPDTFFLENGSLVIVASNPTGTELRTSIQCPKESHHFLIRLVAAERRLAVCTYTSQTTTGLLEGTTEYYIRDTGEKIYRMGKILSTTPDCGYLTQNSYEYFVGLVQVDGVANTATTDYGISTVTPVDNTVGRVQIENYGLGEGPDDTVLTIQWWVIPFDNPNQAPIVYEFTMIYYTGLESVTLVQGLESSYTYAFSKSGTIPLPTYDLGPGYSASVLLYFYLSVDDVVLEFDSVAQDTVAWLTYDYTNLYVTFNDISFLGTHQVIVKETWRDTKFFEETFESSFEIIFESLTESIDTLFRFGSDYAYEIHSNPIKFDICTYTENPSGLATIPVNEFYYLVGNIYVSASSLPWFTWDNGNQITIQSEDEALVGTTVTISQVTTYGSVSGRKNVFIHFSYSCDSDSLSTSQTIDSQTQWLDDTQQVTLFKMDDYALVNFYSSCGDQLVTVKENGAEVDFVNVENNVAGIAVLTITTSDEAHIGTHDLVVTWALSLYPAITATQNMVVNILGLVPPTILVPPMYTIFSPTATYTLDYFTIEPAEFADSYTITYVLTFNDGSALSNGVSKSDDSTQLILELYSRDIQVQWDLMLTASAVNGGQTYYTYILVFSVYTTDPCETTILNSDSSLPVTLILAEGGSQIVLLLSPLTDSADLLYHVDADIGSICGDQVITLSKSQDNVLLEQGEESTSNLKLQQPAGSSSSISDVEVIWTLSRYGIEYKQTFQVLTTAIIKFAVTLPVQISGQQYSIAENSLVFSINHFSIEPKTEESKFTHTYTIYEKTTKKSPEWLTFQNTETFNFNVFSEDIDKVGIYTIIIKCISAQISNPLNTLEKIYEFTIQLSEFDLCGTKSLTVDPDAETYYNYTIGQSMTALVFEVTREPYSTCFGDILITVNQISADLQTLFGITVYQETQPDGSSTTLYLYQDYSDSDIEWAQLEIMLGYSIGGIEEVYFPLITFDQTVQSAPYFDKDLDEADMIPCLTNDRSAQWFYQFPEATDDQDDEITYFFDSPSTGSTIIFNDEELTLELDRSSSTLHVGTYYATMTLEDSAGSSTEYEVIFTSECDPKSYTTAQRDFERPSPPKPLYSSVNSNGEIRILWDQEMSTQVQGGRSLQESQYSAVDLVYVKNSADALVSQSKLKFTYKIGWVNSTMSLIKLEFEAPQYVSQDSTTNDEVIIMFNNTEAFSADQFRDINVEQDTNLTLQMPHQYPKGAIKIDTESLQSASTNLVRFGFILKFLFSAVMNQLLNVIENLSIISHMFIFQLSYPINLQDFFAGLFPLITFDSIPTDEIYDILFGFTNIEDSPISDQFDAVGYASRLSIVNMGSLFLVDFVVIPACLILIIFFWCWFRICKPRNRVTKYIHKKVKNSYNEFFYNGILQTMDASLLVMTIIAIVQINNLSFSGTPTQSFCGLVAIFVLVVNMLLPVVIGLLLWRNLKQAQPVPDLNDLMSLEELRTNYGTINIQQIHKHAYTESKHKKLMDKYGYFLQNIDIPRIGKRLAIITVLSYIIRKLLVGISVITLQPLPTFSIFMFNFSTQFMIMFIVYVRPFENPKMQLIKVLQEIVTMIINYHLFCFTDWVDVDTRAYVASSVMLIVSLQSMFFFAWILWPIVGQGKLWCRRRKLRRKNKKDKKKVKQEAAAVVLPEAEFQLPLQGKPQIVVSDIGNQLLSPSNQQAGKKIEIPKIDTQSNTQHEITIEEISPAEIDKPKQPLSKFDQFVQGQIQKQRAEINQFKKKRVTTLQKPTQKKTTYFNHDTSIVMLPNLESISEVSEIPSEPDIVDMN